MREIEGGVTATPGIKAAGVPCGIKEGGKSDLALIYSVIPCKAVGLFTTNKVKSASIKVSMKHLADGQAQAVIINSGNANAVTGKRGLEDAKEIARRVALQLHIKTEDVLVASTGRIGIPLPIGKITKGLKEIVGRLSEDGGDEAARAILTTDTFPKVAAGEVDLNGRPVVVGGMAKGAGMIFPNMQAQLMTTSTGQATMLAFITTDCAIDTSLLRSALVWAVDRSFNTITVDGVQSTNDMVMILANGLAENQKIFRKDSNYQKFCQVLAQVTTRLAKLIVKDAEGATKFVEVEVRGALNAQGAKLVAFSIANSNLVKTMLYGGDPNWGRIMAAIGSSGAQVEEARIEIYVGDLKLASGGCGVEFSPAKAASILREDEIKILVDLNLGREGMRVWTCDLTPEYVKLNA
jgi:glutamate N-acetyltransferase/amino-acid N-acetyltransferase